MRIAFIGQKAVPFYRDGGVERHVEELATRLAKAGHEVTVFVRRRYVATKEDIWRGVRLVRVPEIPTKHLGTISSTLFATLQLLLRTTPNPSSERRGKSVQFPPLPPCGRSPVVGPKSFPPCPRGGEGGWEGGAGGQFYDVIHFHGVGPSLLSWIPRLFTRAKVVVTFHSIDRFHAKWGPLAQFVLWLGEWTATHFPHATIAVSHSIAAYCKKTFGKTVRYIPNGVDIHKVANDKALAQWGLKKNRYILTVARLVRHKGIHTLIEAYKSVPDAIKGEMKLVIVGAPSFTADYDEYLKELAKEDHRIIFTGYQTGETLAQLYSHAYLYAHPSEYEGLSLTILEAMSYGKCVLISDILENLEAIDHAGVPFAVSNAADLAEKLTTLINHPEIVSERGKLALGFIKRGFSWDKVMEETKQLYKSLIKEAE